MQTMYDITLVYVPIYEDEVQDEYFYDFDSMRNKHPDSDYKVMELEDGELKERFSWMAK